MVQVVTHLILGLCSSMSLITHIRIYYYNEAMLAPRSHGISQNPIKLKRDSDVRLPAHLCLQVPHLIGLDTNSLHIPINFAHGIP